MDQTPPREVTTNQNLIDIRPNTMVQVALLGIVLGGLSWLISALIDRFIAGALLCGSNGPTCESSTLVAGNAAIVLVAIGGLLGLVRLGIYRPLLVVIAAAIVLWGISGFTLGMQWYEAMAWTVLFTAIVYTAFAWLVRPRFFLFAIILVLIVVVLARLLPVLI
jgi:hypothetical protein